jgi:hypothetical protein
MDKERPRVINNSVSLSFVANGDGARMKANGTEMDRQRILQTTQLQTAIFWDYPYVVALVMEVVSASQTSINFYKVQGDNSHLHTTCCGNPISHDM